jgi:hypothetical protein
MFIARNKDEEEFLRQLAFLPDRLVGLLAPVLVDTRIEIAIRSRWKDDAKQELLRDLFRDGGALGAFGTRIKIGYAIGLYGDDALHELRILNSIRNDFAHRFEFSDFDNESIQSRGNSLKMSDKYPRSSDSGTGIFETTGLSLWESFTKMVAHSMVAPPVNARTKFMRTVEILSTFLFLEDYIARSPGIPIGQVPTPPRF